MSRKRQNNLGEDYGAALKLCVAVAREEYRYAEKTLNAAKDLITELRTEVDSVCSYRHPKAGSATSEAQERLKELGSRLEATALDSFSVTENSLAKKKEQLKSFTVTLFGRTMAGKSTIREALTFGGGETIGKGAQRATRDIREYEWNHLRIIDTPGLGAYEGEKDRELALSVVDESDLLIFLASSDGIQEESFRGMKALRDQNKPVIFVLNVKRDIDHKNVLNIPNKKPRSVAFKKFINDSDFLFGEKEIGGHLNRIRRLATDELGMRYVTIIPIHAQAAFLATCKEYEEESDSLHRASRVNHLLRVLTNEVQTRGPVRRLQTMVDGTTNQMIDLEELLREQSKVIGGRAAYLKEKFSELDEWLDDYIENVNERIEHEANVLLRPLRSSVSVFIDENIERKDVEKLWKQRIKDVGIESWMKKYQQQLLDEVRSRLEEFSKELEVESELTGEFATKGPEQYDPWDVKRTLRWTSAGGAALAGVAAVAAWIGGANFWNPVGWVAGGVSVIAFGLSWLFSDREKKMQKKKAEAAEQLRQSIDKMERSIANAVKGWFYENITRRLVKGIRKDTRSLYSGMFKLSSALKDSAANCSDIISSNNLRLILRCGDLLEEEVESSSIGPMVRDPGIRTKFIWTGDEPSESFCREVGKALGEWINGINESSTKKMLAASLVPAKVDHNKINIRGKKAVVRVPSGEVGKAIGHAGHNVRLASRLLGYHIDIRTLEEP